jgi:hypothetical protein
VNKPTPAACPKCGGQVDVGASGGGRGTGDLTSYRADCAKCGTLVDHLSDTGRHDNAVRDYNRWARDYSAPGGATSITVQGGYFAFGSGGAILSPAPPAPTAGAARHRLGGKREVSTDEQSRERRMKNFAVRAEPTREPDFEGEKTIYVTKNGRQEYPTSLAPHEARKLFDLLRDEFGF